MFKSLILALVAIFSITTLLYAEEEQPSSFREKQQQPPRREKQEAGGGEREAQRRSETEFSDRKMWRAFNEMSVEERENVRELQNSNPEEFEKVMNERIALIEEREKKQQQQLEEIVKNYQSATTEEAKTLNKEQLREILKERYLKRLENNRTHIEELRKRVKELDEDLTMRENEAEKFVEEQTERILNNEEPSNKRESKGRKPRPEERT